jgi:ribonuclease D
VAAYELITTPPALAACVDRLTKETVIALDTEASSFHRFRESVCLIQISTREHTFLIDPLSVKDLAPLSVLLVQKGMEVVIHDADYDLRILGSSPQHQGGECVRHAWLRQNCLNEPEIGLGGAC